MHCFSAQSEKLSHHLSKFVFTRLQTVNHAAVTEAEACMYVVAKMDRKRTQVQIIRCVLVVLKPSDTDIYRRLVGIGESGLFSCC